MKRIAWILAGLLIAVAGSSTELTRQRNNATRIVFSFYSSADGTVIAAPGTVTCYCEDYDDNAAWDGTETACTTADTVTGNRVEQQLTAAETNTDFVHVRCTSTATNSMDREFAITTQGLFATTEAQASVDVTATGEVGIDWNNIGTPTATVDLANTTTGTVDTATALGANAVNNTSTNLTETLTANPAAGGIAAGSFAANAITDAAVANDVQVALAAGAVTNASLAGNMEIVYETDFATNYDSTENVWQVWDLLRINHAVANSFGAGISDTLADVVDVLVDTADMQPKFGAISGSGQNTILGYVQSLARSDVTVSSDIGGTYDDATDSQQAIADGGSGLTAADVWNYDIPSNYAPSGTSAGSILDKMTEEATTLSTDVALGSIFGQLLDDGTAWSYSAATDSQEALRNHVGDGTNLTEAGGTGDHLTAIDLPDQTMNITGNLSGSVGSVTGAVGSVTGAVGSVTGNVGGNVTGSVGSVVADVEVGSYDAALDFNATQDASIQAQATAALEADHLDHLFAADYDPATPPGVATAWANELVESDVGVTRFTANALEQAPVGGTGLTAEQTRAALGGFGGTISVVGSPTSLTLDNGPATIDVLNDRYTIAFFDTSDSSEPVCHRRITDWTAARVITLDSACGVTLTTSDTYAVMPNGIGDAVVQVSDATSPIQTDANGYVLSDMVEISGDATAANNAELWFNNTGFSASNSSVGSVTAVTTVAGLSAGAIGVGDIAANAVNASALATDAADEIRDTIITADQQITVANGAVDSDLERIEGQLLGGTAAQIADNFTQFYNITPTTTNTVDDVGATAATDWSSAEQNQIRQALGVTGTTAATTGTGEVDLIFDEVANINGEAMRGTDSAATAAALTTHDGKLDTVDANVDLALADTADMQPRVVAIETDTSTDGVLVSDGSTGSTLEGLIAVSQQAVYCVVDNTNFTPTTTQIQCDLTDLNDVAIQPSVVGKYQGDLITSTTSSDSVYRDRRYIVAIAQGTTDTNEWNFTVAPPWIAAPDNGSVFVIGGN